MDRRRQNKANFGLMNFFFYFQKFITIIQNELDGECLHELQK